MAWSAVLDRVEWLRGTAYDVEELPGGLTNVNLKVSHPGGVVVVRVSQHGSDLLGIDREAEHANTAAAAEAGVGAPVIDYLPAEHLLVIGYLPGRALVDRDFEDEGVMTRAADAVRRLHAGPRFVNDFDMFARQAGYLATISERGFRLPPTYGDHADAWDDVRRALAIRPRPTVPCNNDLLAANFIDDGAKVWLIDYEYSGNNDPCFELGNTATECGFTPEMTEAWTVAYFGEPTSADLARVRLQALCSCYGWSLWGFIQAATSPLDFDFWSWGMERFEKAEKTFADSSFPRLLEEVTHG